MKIFEKLFCNCDEKIESLQSIHTTHHQEYERHINTISMIQAEIKDLKKKIEEQNRTIKNLTSRIDKYNQKEIK